MEYFCTINGNGLGSFHKGSIPSVEAGLVGNHVDGKVYKPCKEALKARVHPKYHKAIGRAQLWFRDGLDQFYITLRTTRGKYIATAYFNKAATGQPGQWRNGSE